MPAATALQRILAPLSVDEFAEKYFQQRPLKISGKSGKFEFLFREADFLLNLDRVKHIRAVFPKNRQARIQPNEIPDMLEAGATICVTGMERAHVKLRNAAERIRSELNYAGNVSFRAYLSPPGSGFDLHFDARIATTLQIAGTKRWWFSDQPAVPFPAHNSGREPKGVKRHKAPSPRTLRSVLLRPGDVLCLPAGVWHSAKGSTASLALNMAFDHNGGGVFDSIVTMLEQRLGKDAAWREPLPITPGGQTRRMPAAVAAMLRRHIGALRAELVALEQDEAELTRAWRSAVRSAIRR
jgi:ribosomal protein L16 Arg81 hydroxylase